MKNKKILGALAALCMGIILCVSSVFAINYWYTIDDSETNNSTVKTGHVVELVVANDGIAETGLYPNGTVTFDTITVEAPDWESATPGIANPQLPTFDLVFEAVSDDAEGALVAQFQKVEVNVDGAGWQTVTGALAVDQVLVADLQAGDKSEVQVRLTLHEDAPASLAGKTLTVKVTIVESTLADAPTTEYPVAP